MREAILIFPGEAAKLADSQGMRAVRLTFSVLLVLLVCHFSTQIGFAFKIPPHNISPLWPTGAILFSVLVVSPVRHWWAYIIAAYFTSVVNDARAGFPTSAMLFLIAGMGEILIAAVAVRRFAGGRQAVNTTRGLAIYIAIAVVLAPALSAFVGALAGGSQSYWFYWRAWFLSEALAFLMLAPAILSWMGALHIGRPKLSLARFAEAGLLVLGLIAVCVRVFDWPTAAAANVPALVYLPLPFLLWAAARFGPFGINTCLLVLAFLSIAGTVNGNGPFATGSPAENVPALQLFLAAVSIPLMLLAALIQESRDKTNALRESEARFRSMADSAPMMIWMTDIGKRGEYFNKQWLDFTGRTTAQELGEGWVESVHPEDLDHCIATCTAAFQAREPFNMEFRLRHRDGEYRWIADYGIPRYAPDGAFAGFIGSCVDISDVKRDELQLQEQRAELTHLSRVAVLGELTGALAHELNQPLTAILSNAQAAQRFLAQAPARLSEVHEILKDIVDEDKRAGEVIRRLRVLLKKGEVQLQPLDVNELVNDVLELARADCVSRGVALQRELDPSLPAVLGDRVQLQQVLLNLIVNACDAMSTCEPRDRRLTITTSLGQSGTVQVCVSDCGHGIPADQLDRLFEPFYTTKPQGLGLGLTICRSIVAAHGGNLWAENNAAGGASLCLSAPAQPGDVT